MSVFLFVKTLIHQHTPRLSTSRLEKLLKLAKVNPQVDAVKREFDGIEFDKPIKKEGGLCYRPNKDWFDRTFPRNGYDFVVAYFSRSQYSLGGKNECYGTELGNGRATASRLSTLYHETLHELENHFIDKPKPLEVKKGKDRGKFVHLMLDQGKSFEDIYRYVGTLVEKYGDPYDSFEKSPSFATKPFLLTPNIKNIAIHHTASPRASGKEQLYPVDKFHRETRGYPKSSLGWNVGYNYFVDVSGKVTQTRLVGEETMAQVGHNCDIESRCDTISICLAGNFDIELPSDAQIKALRTLLKDLQTNYPNAKPTFHRSLQKNRTCPGRLFTKEYLDTRILEKPIFREHIDLPTLSALEKALKWLQVNSSLLFNSQ